jgi:uncharacterized protein (TIGR04552 family)
MQELLPVERFGLRELEEIRLVLRGGSVIDWRRLYYRDRDEVDAFLRLAQLRPDRPDDEARLREILDEAVAFLRTELRYKVAEPVANPREIHDLFLMASGVGEHRRLRRIACVALKVMHTIFHTDAREHLFRTPISSKDFASLIDLRVRDCAEQLLASGAPVLEFVGSVKSRESVIAKLLAKRESVAAQIFDKVRYRIVTEREADILPVLHYLSTNLFPFAFTVPAQTQNTLIPFRKIVEETPELAPLIPELQMEPGFEERERRRVGVVNEYSGPTYRVLNFVADVPLRLDDYLTVLDGRRPTTGPQIAFAPVEFQLMDRATAEQNELGENSHERYKRRQRVKVLRRLARGLVVPKRTAEDEI